MPKTLIGNIKVWDLMKQKDIIVPDGVEKIGNHWFCGCHANSVTIPATVKEIGASAFCECRSLKHIYFQGDSKLELICKECFSGSGLEEITIPRNVKELQKLSFEKCEHLTTVVFQEGSMMKKIGDYAFLHSKSLSNISLPEGLEHIGC